MSNFTDRIQRLNSQDLNEIEEVFGIFDRDGDGLCPVKDIGELMRALDQNPTQADIDRALGSSIDRKGYLTFDEFLPILKDIVKTRGKHTPDEFCEGLRHFDNDLSGTINGGELRRLLTGLGEQMEEEEVEELLTGLEDEKGMVNYEQLVRMVISGGTPATTPKGLLETSLDA